MDGDSSTTDASQLGISADYIGGSHYVIQPHDDTEDSMNDHEDTNGSKESFREQDIYLPIANVARIMKNAIPQTGKIAKDAKECVQECVSEFISFITSEASERCHQEKRKTINGEDILFAMSTLGFDSYVEPLKLYLQKFREAMKGEKGIGGAVTATDGLSEELTEEAFNDDSETAEEMEDEIPVVICAAAGRMGAAMAAINSIYSNTDANILFYVVGLRNTLSRIRKWIEHSKLREINFKIVEFNPVVLKGKIRPDSSRPELLQPLNFVRFYLPLLIHQHEKVIYLDDDVIVQGDIQELYDTTLALGHAAAFSDDCDLPSSQDIHRLVGLQNTYMGYLDYRKKTIKDLGISPSTCSFNPGVIVANMTEWKHQRITKQLEKWMQKNVEENLYSSSLGGGVATSPMLIVFHGKYSTINPLWHIRHLGWNPDTRYSEHFLQEAKLLHWNGRHKPWDFPSVHNDLWESWFVPDPAGIFKLHHPNS
ncbi:hypothetical protein G4228_014415 [Cervus hanglu yarkandensis]|nr:hypothetical protein G4228_014415 [Cervus hanglu yarkandensis]